MSKLQLVLDVEHACSLHRRAEVGIVHQDKQEDHSRPVVQVEQGRGRAGHLGGLLGQGGLGRAASSILGFCKALKGSFVCSMSLG